MQVAVLSSKWPKKRRVTLSGASSVARRSIPHFQKGAYLLLIIPLHWTCSKLQSSDETGVSSRLMLMNSSILCYTLLFCPISRRSSQPKHKIYRDTHFVCSINLCRSVHPREARLFQGSTATGSFKVEEIAGFDQSDLAVGKYIAGGYVYVDDYFIVD